MMSSSVVLPPPFRPTTPTRSPRSTPSDTASSRTREASPGTWAVTASRLTRLAPARRHQRRPSGRAVTGRAARRRRRCAPRAPVRAPPGRSGTPRPRPARPPRRWPTPARSRGTRRSDRPGDQPGQRAGVDPGAQRAAQLGGHADRGRLQVVAQLRAELAGVTAGQRLQHGSTARSGAGRRRAAGPARRTRRAWASPPRCRAITQCWGWRESTGTIRSPRPGAERGAAVQREGDVAAQLGGERAQLVAGEVQLPQRESPTRAAAASALPPAIPPADGDALAQHQPRRPVAVGRSASSCTGPPGEVGLVDGHLGHALAVHLDRGTAGGHRHLVEQAHRVEHGDQLVVAVGPWRAHLEMQIDLGGHAHGDRGRDGGGHPSTLRAARIRPPRARSQRPV
jgi:hypothetical protein